MQTKLYRRADARRRKQSLHAFDLRQLARQRHGIGRFAEKSTHAVAPFLWRRYMVRQNNGRFAAAQRLMICLTP